MGAQELPFETPAAALAHQAAERGDAEALAFPQSGGRLSFAAWHQAAEALAGGLLDLGLGPGDHLALLAENRLEWPLVQLAVARLGAVLVPLNSHYRRDDLAYVLAQSKSRAIITSRRFRSNPYLETIQDLRPQLPLLEHVVLLDGPEPGCHDLSALKAMGRERLRGLPDVSGESPAALLYTSGTTGFPKGALLTHRAMLGNAWGTGQRLGLDAGDRWTSMIPLFHCAGCVMNLLGCLQAGACYVGLPSFDPPSLFALIEQERCSHLSGVPTAYLAMLDHPERSAFDLSSLRAGTCGGADANPAVLRRCAELFPMPGLTQVYGQTESATLITCPGFGDPKRFDTAGRPLPEMTVRISDPQSGRPLPQGEIGQIEARGPCLMLGYYEDAEATAATIAPDGWLKTGDLGFLTEDGDLVIAGGRLRDMIIRGGENIYPAEIEAVLLEHPAVAECAVFGLPDDYYGEVVAAAVRLEGEVAAVGLSDFTAERIARFKAPAQVFAVAGFPTTASGKIRKTELRRLARAGELEVLP